MKAYKVKRPRIMDARKFIKGKQLVGTWKTPFYIQQLKKQQSDLNSLHEAIRVTGQAITNVSKAMENVGRVLGKALRVDISADARLSNGIERVLKMLDDMEAKYGEYFDNYKAHLHYIEEQAGEIGLDVILQILKVYVDRYQPKKDLRKINKREQALIKDLIDELVNGIEKQGPESVLANYYKTPSHHFTSLIKQALNNSHNVKSTRRGQIVTTQADLYGETVRITSKKGEEFFQIELQTKEKLKGRVKNGAKLFTWFMQKVNEQNWKGHARFQLQELVDIGLYKTKETAYVGLKNVVDIMFNDIAIEGKHTAYIDGKKQEIRNIKAHLIAQRDISRGYCEIVFPPIITEMSRYITILPKWAYRLSETGFMLLDYLYIMARMRTSDIKSKHYFDIGLDAVRIHLGLPAPKDAGKDPKRLIFDPIEKAIEEIENARDGTNIKITPIYDHQYKNINEYLQGYLRVELDTEAENYMVDLADRQEKQYKKRLKMKEQAQQKALEKLTLKQLEDQITGQQIMELK